MPALSVVIITKNEEQNIARCLESIKDIADDTVIVDSFSTDHTEAICRTYNVRFFQHAWEGYSAQKNYANSLALYDWVFSIDADEALSDELSESIRQLKKNPEPVNYRICRITNYCGKWIHHGGWYPDIKLRFFDRRFTRWEGLIHERLNAADEKKIPVLKGDCYHYSYYSIEGHHVQADKFSTLVAEDLFRKGKKAGWPKMLISPGLKFFRMFILSLGFLDGREGFIIARISAQSVFNKYYKLRRLYANRTS